MVILQACRAAAFSLYGYFNFTKSAFLEHAKKFKHEDMEVDITGKNCIVTGSNSGIGFEAAKALAARGATVYMICRSKERGEKALSEIRTNTGNDNVYLEICDLSSPLQIKEFAQKFMSQDKALYALVNNAGLLENERKLTADGLELNFAVNVVGVFTLTELLLPSLEKAAPDSRVITVSSGGMYGSPLHSDLQFSDGKFNGVMQYSRNKRLQVAITESWAEKYGNKGIGFYSMHPGWAETPGVTQSMPEFHSRLGNKLRTAEQGADTIVWLSLRPNANLRSGGFYFDRSETTKHLPGLFTTYTPNQLNPILESIRSLSGLFPSL